MAQRAPHRKMFLFIYVYIYFLYDFTYGRAILFFCFFQPSWDGVGLQSTFLKIFDYSWKKKPVVWMWIDDVYRCVLVTSTDVYWYVYWWIKWLWVGFDKSSNAHWIGALVPMCPVHIGTHQYTSDLIKEAMHIGLVLLCPCAQTDRPKKKTPKSTGECGKTNKNMQKMSLVVKGELTPIFFWALLVPLCL